MEWCFAEFETLRENVLSAVSNMPQCTCQYCMDFLVYIRYKYSQPRGIVKLTAGTEKRRQILTTFINDFVIMGQRRAPTLGKRKCEAQSSCQPCWSRSCSATRRTAIKSVGKILAC